MSFHAESPPAHWLRAYSTVMTQSEDERTAFMLRYIRAEQNVRMQAMLLSQLEHPLLQLISADERVFYRARFNGALSQSQGLRSTDKEDKTVLLRGLTSLYIK